MLNAGMSATVVSRHFGCTRNTIERLRKRFRVTGNVADRPRSGRPSVTTAADDRYIVLLQLRKNRLIAAATGRQYGIHPQTFTNRLRQNGQPIRAYWPYFGQILTRRHRTARRDWCRRHLHFRRADWNLILFSDECRFKLSHADGCESLSPSGRAFFLCVRHWAGPFWKWFNLSLLWDNIQRYVNSKRRCITVCIAQNGGHMRYWHISLNLQSLFVSWYPSKWIWASPIIQLCLTKLILILEIDPYVISLDFFQWKNYHSDFKFSRHVSKEWFFITDKRNSQNLS